MNQDELRKFWLKRRMRRDYKQTAWYKHESQPCPSCDAMPDVGEQGVSTIHESWCQLQPGEKPPGLYCPRCDSLMWGKDGDYLVCEDCGWHWKPEEK